MTDVDLALAALVLLGGVWGAWQGAFQQVGNVMAWIASGLVPWAFAGPLAHLLQRPLAAPFPVVYCFVIVGLSLVAHVAVRILFYSLHRAWLKRPPASVRQSDPSADSALATRIAVDRSVGAIAGTVETAAIVWLALSFLVIVAGSLQQHEIGLTVRGSVLFELARRHNALGPVFRTDLRRLDRALHDLESPPEKGVKRSAAFTALGRDPRVREMSKDAALRKDLAAGDLTALARSPDLLSFVTDAEAMTNAAEVFVTEL